MKHRDPLSPICLVVAVMFVMSVSVHPAMAYDAINQQLDDASSGGMEDLSSIPGLEGKKIPTISIREVSPEHPGPDAAGLSSGTVATVRGAQTKHFSSALTISIRDPRSVLMADSSVTAAAGAGNTDPVLAGIIANMSANGYDLTGESTARYESTVQSDDFLDLNASQKQALADGGFALTASDTVVSRRDATYYTLTNRTTQSRIYLMGVQRTDAGGNPIGDREYTVSPEFNDGGTPVASAAGPGMAGATSSGSSCWWWWLALGLLLLGLVVVIALIIAFAVTTPGLGTPVTIAWIAEGIGYVAYFPLFKLAISENIGNALLYSPNPGERMAAMGWVNQAGAAFSAQAIASLVAAGLLILVSLIYVIFSLGVCKGWWGQGLWGNHDWDYDAGEYGPVDNGKPLDLFRHDRFLLSLYADTGADKDARWTIASQGNLVVRQSGSVEIENGMIQSWIVEATEVGKQNLILKYETTKPVPPLVGITEYTLPLTVKEIPWRIDTVDAGFHPTPSEPMNSFTQYVSLAYDPSGVPHIAYYHEKNYGILYATLADGEWSREKLKGTGPYASNSLAFDPAGDPVICYGNYHNAYEDFVCSHRNGSAWLPESVADGAGAWKVGEAGPGYFSSQVIDPAGIPHVLYNNGKKGDKAALMYATRTGTAWSAMEIARVQNYLPSMAMDRAGLLHAAYSTDASGGPVMYAVQDASGSWQVNPVAGAYDRSSGNRHAGYKVSLALDSAENPHISYYDKAEKDLRYVSWNGTDWNTETVHAQGDVGKFSSLAINADDRPFIAYYDATDLELRFATKTPGSDRWSVHTVDSNPGKPIKGCGVGEYASLALDPGGNPDIAYYDCPNHALKFAGWKN